MLGDLEVVHVVELLTVPESSGADHCVLTAFDCGGLVEVLVEVGAVGYKLANALPEGVQAKFQAGPDEEAEVAVAVRFVFFHPLHEVIPAFDLQVAINGATQPDGFQPVVAEVVHNRHGPRHILERRG